jgi:DNA-binding response OmpR family regulator
LKANGYAVISAVDAISSIAVTLKETPDLMILDLELPNGGGFVILEGAGESAAPATVPVIVLSARDPVDNEKRALDTGAVAYFQKPPDNQEFLAAIREALGERITLSTDWP